MNLTKIITNVTLTMMCIIIAVLSVYGAISIYDNAHRPQMHKPVFVWNDDIEGLPADGSSVVIEKTINDTIYLGVK